MNTVTTPLSKKSEEGTAGLPYTHPKTQFYLPGASFFEKAKQNVGKIASAIAFSISMLGSLNGCSYDEKTEKQAVETPACEDGEMRSVECGDACIGERIDTCKGDEWKEGECSEFEKILKNDEISYKVTSTDGGRAALITNWESMSSIRIIDSAGNRLWSLPNSGLTVTYQNNNAWPGEETTRTVSATIRPEGYALLSGNQLAVEAVISQDGEKHSKILVCSLPREGSDLELVVGGNCSVSSTDDSEDRLAYPQGFSAGTVLMGTYRENGTGNSDLIIKLWDTATGHQDILAITKPTERLFRGALSGSVAAYFDSELGPCTVDNECPYLVISSAASGETKREIRDGMRNGLVDITAHGHQVAYTPREQQGSQQVHLYDTLSGITSMIPEQTDSERVEQPQLTETHLLYHSQGNAAGTAIHSYRLANSNDRLRSVRHPASDMQYAADTAHLFVTSDQGVDVCPLR